MARKKKEIDPDEVDTVVGAPTRTSTPQKDDKDAKKKGS